MKEFFYKIATDQISGVSTTPLKAILWVLSQMYGCSVRLMIYLYQHNILKRHRLPKPVISVGNIVLGGVGKTPLVIYIAEKLMAENIKPAILLRGYMGGSQRESDEATMLKERLPTVPILAGANRFKTATEFLKNHSADVFLMDDGFQHWKLQRDLEIVVLDAASPWGNGHLIPRGILREHLSGLRRADMIVLAKADLGEGLSSINKKLQQIGLNKTPVVEAQHRPEHLVDVRKQQGMSLDFIRDKKVCLFSGIGNPASFTQTVQQLGARISKQFNFMDHHVYTKEDAQTISRFCLQEKINILLTTHKDAVKLKSLLNEFDTSISLVTISINVSLTRNENVFAQRIHHLLHR